MAATVARHVDLMQEDARYARWFSLKLDARTVQRKVDAMGPAAMIAAEAGGITGHITALGHEPHHYTIFYVDVDDVGAYLEKAKSLGGKMLVPQVSKACRYEEARGRVRGHVGSEHRVDTNEQFART